MKAEISTLKNPSILIIKPSSLGDIVHTLPAVHCLKKRWPESKIRWISNPEWASLLRGNPCVDDVVIFPRNEFRSIGGMLKAVRWAKTLRTLEADLVLDFQGLLRSALIARACRGKQLFGLSDAREGARFFYDEIAKVDRNEHAVQRYLKLVARLGADVSQPLEFPLPVSAHSDLPQDFDPQLPFIVLHPFARGAGKSLTANDVQIFCEQLAPQRVVIVGKGEKSDEQLSLTANCTNLVNRTTLTELIAVLRRAQFTVSVDSGPMHIAAAISDRLLGIHKWSDPRRVGPFRPNAFVWKSGRILQMKTLMQKNRKTEAKNSKNEKAANSDLTETEIRKIANFAVGRAE